VKAELDKLGAPSRSFSEYLALETSGAQGDAMEDCAALGQAKKWTMNERFAKIEHARPAVHPVTIRLANRLKNVLEEAGSPRQNPEQPRNKQNNNSSRVGNNAGGPTKKQGLAQQSVARRQNRYRK
jgi:hypothetical protein